MKKLIIPVITLIIGLIVGYYYSNSKTTGNGKIALSENGYASENSISRDEAQMLVDTFGMYGLEDVKHQPGGKGSKTRSVFMPLTKLDSLVAALDAERKKDGITDGIRIYMGRYPKMEVDGKTPYAHPFRNTIILVSTRHTQIQPKGGKEPIWIHLDYFGAPNPKMPMHLFAIDPENRGELCPNNCDGASLVCPDPTDPTCGCN